MDTLGGGGGGGGGGYVGGGGGVYVGGMGVGTLGGIYLGGGCRWEGGVCTLVGGIKTAQKPLKNRSNLAWKTVQKSPQEMSGFWAVFWAGSRPGKRPQTGLSIRDMLISLSRLNYHSNVLVLPFILRTYVLLWDTEIWLRTLTGEENFSSTDCTVHVALYGERGSVPDWKLDKGGNNHERKRSVDMNDSYHTAVS